MKKEMGYDKLSKTMPPKEFEKLMQKLISKITCPECKIGKLVHGDNKGYECPYCGVFLDKNLK